jgi:hypothetical protein
MSDHDHLRVTFYTEAVENAAETRKQGRPIFEDKEFVFILIGGDPKSTLRAPAHDQTDRDPATGEGRTYAQKYPEEYRFFKANEDQHQKSGTPLTEVPWLTAAQREELKALKIFTVEMLAGLDGTMLQRIGMGARELKNKAQAWLDAAAGSAVESRLAGENAALRDQMEAMQAQINQMLQGGTLNNVNATTPADIEEPEVELPSNSPFEQWADEDIKNWIKESTGNRPPGNPSHKTLVAKADEINAQIAEQKAA